MAPIELTYFNMAGRGELTRLVLTYGNVEFQDTRLSFETYAAQKSKMNLPFGQLPTLQVNDTTYAQSIAIARYAAKLAGLYPEAPLAALEADAIVDTVTEIHNAVIDVLFYEKDEGVRATKWQKLSDESVPRTLANFEKRVQGNFFTGDAVTFADIALLNLVHNVLTPNAQHIKLDFHAYPKLHAIVTALRESSPLASYLNKQ
ncbi:hypothetical protein DAPPUDRAFT_277532 [Daphnia pulex]|uniref:glutathione transferase n=1 Tax=Daphnia pulex TaxID=6669 RepID=E9I6F0_DAPPU|nr:hypothetical protein DAPPUDRAFT_277532 [Daphnia pulex]|eukprot:EFX60430.1 hypothetical protein DAPPUDRAFT_277532 [Daphnia pulex]